MASVRKRKWTHNGAEKEAWVVSYTDQSGNRRLKTFDKKKDADAHRLRVEVELGDGTHVVSNITFAEVAKHFIAELERRWKIGEVTGYTFEGWKSRAKCHVVPAFGPRLVKDLTSRDFQEFVNDKRSKFAVNTVGNMLTVIHGIMELAFDKGWIKLNPLKMKRVRVPKGKAQERAPIPSKEEVKMILEAVAKRDPGQMRYAYRNRLILTVVALFTGLRKGEICGLRWENIDLASGVLHVRHSLSPVDGLKAPKSAAGVRSLRMSSPVVTCLQWAHEAAGRPTSGYVLSSPRGENLDPGNVWRLWLAVMKKAGLLAEGRSRKDGKVKPKYTFHKLRHVAASLLIQQGLDPFVLKGIIGHASVAVTMNVYGHMFPDDTRGEQALLRMSHEFAALPPPGATTERHDPVSH